MMLILILLLEIQRFAYLNLRHITEKVSEIKRNKCIIINVAAFDLYVQLVN